MPSDSHNSVAVVFGATGGIGSAIYKKLKASGVYKSVFGLSRSTVPEFNLLNEDTIISSIDLVLKAGEVRMAIDATGFLHDEYLKPEKSLRQIDKNYLMKSFEINAIGPALIMKHLLPRLPRQQRAVFATISAKVGSISDNRLGGWYGYRAAKAALNQFVKTAAIEFARQSPLGVCVGIHPGTVNTKLSAPFSKYGLKLQEPDMVASNILDILDTIEASNSGSFYDWTGKKLPW